MEVKPGYKQTEVGVIPAEWEVGPLSSLISYGPRNGYSGRSGKDARGTPTLALTATTSGRMILGDETVKHLEETLEDNSDILLKLGDVLVQRSNTLELVGTTAIFDGPSGMYAYPDLMMRMRFKAPETSHWFWRYANSSAGRRYFVSVAAGSTGTMPKLSGDKLRTMPLPLPPPPEQRAIATALNDVDGLLGGLDCLIAKKRDLKQAAMQQLLTGQTRLPGFNGEWKVKRLGDVAQADWGNTSITKDTYQDDGYAAFSASGQDGYVSWFEHDGPGVVISAIGAQCGKTWLALGRWTPIKNTIWFKGNGHEACTEFLYWKTCDREFWPKSGQAQPFVSVGSVRNAFVTVPRTLAEQTAIAEVLSDMDAELAVLEQRREKTRALKQAMMQELLTGRIRLIN